MHAEIAALRQHYRNYPGLNATNASDYRPDLAG